EGQSKEPVAVRQLVIRDRHCPAILKDRDLGETEPELQVSEKGMAEAEVGHESKRLPAGATGAVQVVLALRRQRQAEQCRRRIAREDQRALCRQPRAIGIALREQMIAEGEM